VPGKLDTNCILQNDFSYIKSELKAFVLDLEQKNSIEFKHNDFLKKNIDESLIKILKSALLSKAKMIRPLFCFWIFRTFFKSQTDKGIPLKSVTRVAISIELLHNASLIIDDIEDDSHIRRNALTIHKAFGMPLALNAASWMYFLSLNYLPDYLQPLVTKALVDCHLGQAIDLSSSKQEFCEDFFWASSKDRWVYYEKCVSFKTTRLILLSLELLKKLLKIKSSEYKFTEKLIIKYGIIYQMFDDLKNVFPNLSGHKLNEDLKNGFRSAVSMQFLDSLTQKEKKIAFNKFKENLFFEHIITHKKFSHAVKDCFQKANLLLNQTSEYIDQHVGQSNKNREYLSFLFELPFVEVKKNIKKNINFGGVL